MSLHCLPLLQAMSNICLSMLCVSVHMAECEAKGEVHQLHKDKAWANCYLNRQCYQYSKKKATEEGSGTKSVILKLLSTVCVGDVSVLAIYHADAQAKLVLLKSLGCTDVALKRIANWMNNISDRAVHDSCDCCGLVLKGLLVTQCGHLVCSPCVIAHSGGIERLTRWGRNMTCPVVPCRKLIDLEQVRLGCFHNCGSHNCRSIIPKDSTVPHDAPLTSACMQMSRQ